MNISNIPENQTKQGAKALSSEKKIESDLNRHAGSSILNSLKLFFSDQKFLFALLINLILFSLYFLFFTPRFAINDDPAIMRIASGELLGEPNEHLIFINIIIGHFLKFMYTVLPQLNWYVLLFYFCHFVAMTAVLYVFLRNKFSFYNILLYLLLFVFVEVNFLTNLQFTTTAFVAGISGFLLLFTYESNDLKGKWIWVSIGIILLLISGLIRTPVFYALLLLWVPVILYKAYSDKSYQRILPIVVAVILFFLANQYDANYYNQQPDWNYYSQYNSLRANLTDYAHFAYNEKTAHIYKEVGWSENKVKMFQAWSYADKEVFPLEDLSYIVENIRPYSNIDSEKPENNESDLGETTILSFIPMDLIRGLIFILLVFLTAFHVVQRQERRVLLIALFMLAVAFIYLTYQGRLPISRVFYPMFYNLGLISLFYLSNRNKKIGLGSNNNIILNYLVYIVIAIMAIGIFYFDSINSNSNKVVQERIDNNLVQLAAEEYIYAAWPIPGMFYPLIFSRHYVPSFFAKGNDYDIEILPFGGSFSHSPHHYRKYYNHSIENIYQDLVERDDIILIAHLTLVEDLLVDFMDENYGIKILYVPVLIATDVPAFHISRIDTD